MSVNSSTLFGLPCLATQSMARPRSSVVVTALRNRAFHLAPTTDADPNTVVSVLRQMKAAGKAIVGMKILGQRDPANRQDEALQYALSPGLLDAFPIGAESKAEQEDLIRRIATAA
jgi:1-deoxyxylulose-5-phosphate synthase